MGDAGGRPVVQQSARSLKDGADLLQMNQEWYKKA